MFEQREEPMSEKPDYEKIWKRLGDRVRKDIEDLRAFDGIGLLTPRREARIEQCLDVLSIMRDYEDEAKGAE
jgi:hypothetical protein